MMKLAIVTIVKNEHKYLDEWILYHLNLGFDKIYIYEDEGSLSHKEITDKYDKVELNSVKLLLETIIRPRILTDTVNKWITLFKDQYDWIAHIDVDEFITTKDEQDLKEVLSNFNGNVLMKWHNYNANGHFDEPEKGVLDSYTTECSNNSKDKNIWVTKAFGKTSTNPFWGNVHWTINNNIKQDVIYIRHYITKSFKEFCYKTYVRGDIYNRIYRGLDEFLELNPDFDRERCELYIKNTYGNVSLKATT